MYLSIYLLTTYPPTFVPTYVPKYLEGFWFLLEDFFEAYIFCMVK
jgi:hypothetical protein